MGEYLDLRQSFYLNVEQVTSHFSLVSLYPHLPYVINPISFKRNTKPKDEGPQDPISILSFFDFETHQKGCFVHSLLIHFGAFASQESKLCPAIWCIYEQDKMREVQLGAHTLKSHGVKVARTHMHDWIILLLLVVIDVVLNVIHPFYRFVGEEMISDFKYPLKSNTVPFWAVPLIAILLPFAIIIAIYFRRRDVYDLHHAILGLLFSVLITAVITDAFKDAVGRPRPDFFWRCFPDGKPVYENVTRNVICHGDDHVIKEGHRSFPSGHTSGSFAGLGFLSLYLAGKIKVFDRRGHVAKLCIIFLPLLVAALVGVSRVDDYWHHWQDVFAGGLIGITVATFCYLQFFPAPYHTDGWGTYAYFQMLEESHASAQPTDNVNPLHVQMTGAETVYQRGEISNHMVSHRGHDDGTMIDEMEAGRR